MVSEFKAAFGDDAKSDLLSRLTRIRWPDEGTATDWSQGVPLPYMKELCEYWSNDYDLERVTKRLNRFAQITTNIHGTDIHALHVRSPHPDAMPLIMTHGWPGSIVEFLDVIEPLTNPTAFGGDAANAFHVVCPSLPGYGFSGRPTGTGWGVEQIADAWVELMVRLGYERFGAQGGDWGAFISIKLGQVAPERVAGIHLNLGVGSPDVLIALGDLTPEEEDYLGRFQYYADNEAGYSTQQSTKPQTLGYGLADSPSGQAAWILEKFHNWTDCDGDPRNVLSWDVLLDNISLYWLTNSATSSARLYWESLKAIFLDFAAVEVPVGYTLFPKDSFALSERWAKTRFPDLRHYSVVEKGGHFAALEQPATFVDEVRTAFRSMRD
ncbi:epoxide hydrolase [Rhodococcus sp. ACS1]|nr:epoxide hydrolase family protein [Rhodococcus sp. ACS1]PBC35725.1 epoxide hydrolase [Rhodococcus sp. ACS1]